MAVERTEKPLLERWKFTVDEFQRMGEVGLLKEDDRVELIDGELIRMNPIGHDHAGDVNFLLTWFAARLGARAVISAQNPLRLRPRGQPQPDVMVLRPRADYYRRSHPTADDVLLLIEVADGSLDYDRVTKAAIYAQAGIADYWIVNLVDAQLIVLRQPVEGGYRSVRTLTREDSLSPLAFPDIAISVGEILA
jgi:Uma2 family endonuclease